MAKITIESAENGYILHIESGFSGIQIYRTTEELFERLLQILEGKTKHFGGNLYSEVIIKREKQ